MDSVIDILKRRKEQFSEFFKGFVSLPSSNNGPTPTSPNSNSPGLLGSDDIYDDTGTFKKNSDQLWNWNWEKKVNPSPNNKQGTPIIPKNGDGDDPFP
jgi:hypothetical protein